MKSTLLVLACALSFTACVRSVQQQRPPAAYAVHETMARQVRNAVDAGDGDYRIRRLRERTVTAPTDVQARIELAKLYQDAGFPEIAVEHYRLALTQQPDSSAIVILLIKTLRTMKLGDEARRTLADFVTTHPNTADANSWMGILEDEAGNYTPAEPFHRKAAALDEQSGIYHNNLGYNLLLQGKNGEAAAEFRRALQLNPQSVTAKNNLGLAAPNDAQATWNSPVEAATAHNNLAALLMERGEYDRARQELQIALGYKNDHAVVLRNLQLLAELDGGDVRLPGVPTQRETRWGRFSHAVRLTLLGDPSPGSK